MPAVNSDGNWKHLKIRYYSTYILKIKQYDSWLPYSLICVIASIRSATLPGKEPGNLNDDFTVVINKDYWTMATLYRIVRNYMCTLCDYTLVHLKPGI